MIKQANVGNADRTIRILLGVALLAMVFVGPKTAWGWVGLVPLVTAFLRFCPAYWLVGANTCARTSDA